MWWIVFALQLSSSYAQLTSPDEAVCVGKQVVFGCQQPGSFSSWSVNLPDGTILSSSPSSSQAEMVLTLRNDPGFRFSVHVLSSNSASSIISELSVTAVRQLNGTTVECAGPSGSYMSMILIASVDPPAAPSGVMTIADQSQFTPSTASITLTWSASSGADNYTIMVTPLLPSRQSLVSTTTTSLQLSVLYNEEYSINITAQNCAGSNSTDISLTVAGCSPLSPLVNGSISEYSSGAVGAMLTFQCDTGYMPQEEVTSTCLSNRSWVPTPECEVVDCGDPLDRDVSQHGVIIEPFNNTKFGALITFHCEESNDSIISVCGSDGEWISDAASQCDNVSETIHVTGDANMSYTTVEPSDSQLPFGLYIGISVAALFLLIMLTTLIVVVVSVKKKGASGVRDKAQSFYLDSYKDSNNEDDDQQYAQTRHPGPRGNSEQAGEQEYSVLSNHNISSKIHKTPSGRGDTLIYADLGPSSGKRRTPVTSNIQDDHRVVYSTVNHALQQVTKKDTRHKTGTCPADAALDLDMLLIQLKPQVLTKWKQFAEAVGLSNIIKELSQYSADECIVEVFDQWLKSHPTKPTWRNVADVLNDIGLQQLANDIMKVYQTGELPLVVDMDAVPEMTTTDTETPPPLPPKIDDDDLVPPTRPPKPVVLYNNK